MREVIPGNFLADRHALCMAACSGVVAGGRHGGPAA